ncbi:MAG: divergent polysaccharide deacetylase family protein [Candidatus Krumholzibacteria bacterium]|nr:divergent polysaccharide deacetylase family protein [Candidatus Krumholzibacteria bacterium]
MAGSSKKKTRKKTKKKSSAGAGLGRLAIFLAVAAIVFFAMVKYADTPRGRVFLLDLGFDRYYAEVQSGLGELIKKGATEAGMPAKSITLTTADEPGQDGPVSMIKGDMPADRSLLQLNTAIARALGSSGGRVRACVEKKGGRMIEMEVGTRRTVTHRCVFRMGRRPVRETDRPTGPSITVIVDDFGYFNNRRVREFLALDVPFTVSVIPGLEHSEKICRQAREAGKDVICHLPMEPEKDANDQGDIPLVRTAMSSREIEKIVEKALESTPGVIGMNNHMGSKATADMRVMAAVMKVCRRKKLFFVDSYTTAKSVVAEAAGKAGVKTLRNDLFLDNRGDDVRENMRKALSIASRSGRMTAIMHIRKGNVEHLRWLAQEAEREGVRIVRITDMMGD